MYHPICCFYIIRIGFINTSYFGTISTINIVIKLLQKTLYNNEGSRRGYGFIVNI